MNRLKEYSTALAILLVVVLIPATIFWLKWKIYFAGHPSASWWTFFIR